MTSGSRRAGAAASTPPAVPIQNPIPALRDNIHNPPCPPPSLVFRHSPLAIRYFRPPARPLLLRVLPSSTVIPGLALPSSDKGRFLRAPRVLRGETPPPAAKNAQNRAAVANLAQTPRFLPRLAIPRLYYLGPTRPIPRLRAAARAWLAENAERKAGMRDAAIVPCRLSPSTCRRSSPPPAAAGYRKIPIYDPYKHEHLENLTFQRQKTRYYRPLGRPLEHLPPPGVSAPRQKPRTPPPPGQESHLRPVQTRYS